MHGLGFYGGMWVSGLGLSWGGGRPWCGGSVCAREICVVKKGVDSCGSVTCKGTRGGMGV